MSRSGTSDEASWAAIARTVARRFADNQIPGRAAQMSFYFFLSIFPALLILMATLGMVLDAKWLLRDTILEHLASVAPKSIVGLFTRVLDHLAVQPGKPLTWGIFVALWAASSGMVATIRGLNLAYGVDEDRPWWLRRLLGLGLTLILMLLTSAAMFLVAYGVPIAEAFAQRIELGSAFVLAWRILRWAVAFAFMLLAFNLLYRFAPHRPGARWQWVQPGTMIAITSWLAASLGLKLYVANLANYSVTYGSVGAVIVLLLWFYLTGIAILVGAEINAQSERVRAL